MVQVTLREGLSMQRVSRVLTQLLPLELQSRLAQMDRPAKNYLFSELETESVCQIASPLRSTFLNLLCALLSPFGRGWRVCTFLYCWLDVCFNTLWP